MDKFHWQNHQSCSIGYNMAEYPELCQPRADLGGKKINSQQSEQINRSIRKLATVAAYLGWENYLKLITMVFVEKNLKRKGEFQ